MIGNRGAFLCALATCAVGVASCVAASTASAVGSVGVGKADTPFLVRTEETVEQWMETLVRHADKAGRVWLLLPDHGADKFSTDDVLHQLEVVIAHSKEDRPVADFHMGSMSAIVPAMHGIDAKGLPYELERHGARPVSEAFFESDNVAWESMQVAALLPAYENFSSGARFRLTELPLTELPFEKTMALLEAEGGEVRAWEPPAITAMREPEGFSANVRECIAKSQKSSTPMVECYNLYLGRDPDARWLEELYDFAENDQNVYGPFVITPLERLDRGMSK